MKYEINTCYWCGKKMNVGEDAYSSLTTDTIRTMRNFCSKEHLELFKEKAEGRWGSMRLRPYYGKVKK